MMQAEEANTPSPFFKRSCGNAYGAAGASSARQLRAQLHLRRHLLEQAPVCELPITASFGLRA
jgi:hypothetical protein